MRGVKNIHPTMMLFCTIRKSIVSKLTTKFSPIYLDVINESKRHSSDNAGDQSHFRINIASKHFNNQLKVQRHRMIYQCLSEEVKQTHAMGINAQSQLQFQKQNGQKHKNSPPCVGQKASQ